MKLSWRWVALVNYKSYLILETHLPKEPLLFSCIVLYFLRRSRFINADVICPVNRSIALIGARLLAWSPARKQTIALERINRATGSQSIGMTTRVYTIWSNSLISSVSLRIWLDWLEPCSSVVSSLAAWPSPEWAMSLAENQFICWASWCILVLCVALFFQKMHILTFYWFSCLEWAWQQDITSATHTIWKCSQNHTTFLSQHPCFWSNLLFILLYVCTSGLFKVHGNFCRYQTWFCP